MQIGPDDPEARKAIEIDNLRAAEEYLSGSHDYGNVSITRGLILGVHRLVMRGLYDCAGSYRTALHKVTVGSVTFQPASSFQVAIQMDDAIERVRSHLADDAEGSFGAIVEFFHAFLKIHPFCGGNGRVSRLITNYLLQATALASTDTWVHPYLKVHSDRYLLSLQAADMGNMEPLTTLMGDACVNALLDELFELVQGAGTFALLNPEAQALLDPVQRPPAISAVPPDRIPALLNELHRIPRPDLGVQPPPAR